MLIVEGNSWGRWTSGTEKSKLTEPPALDSVRRGSRNQVLVVAGWRWSSPVAVLTLDQLWTLLGLE